MIAWFYGDIAQASTERRRLVGSVVDRLRVEMAALSIIGIEHQFMLAHLGMPEAVRSAPAIPRHAGLCALVAETGRPLVIDCGPEDLRFRDHEAVVSLGLVAYIGVPLWSRGRVLGVLAGMSRKPRHWTSVSVEVLEELAAGVGGATGRADVPSLVAR